MIRTVLDLMFGCRHRRITRPITPVRRSREAVGDGATYVACLDCGQRLHYDLATMRIGKPLPPGPEGSFQTEFK